METDSLAELDNLKLLRCRFVLRSLGIRWSTFKGFSLHGMLGRILLERSPDIHHLLLGEEHAVGRPFVLAPPPGDEMYYAPGREFAVEMTFFGAAAKGLLYCLAALEEIGHTGIDKERGRFELVRACAVAGQSWVTFYTRESGVLQWPQMSGARGLLPATGAQPVGCARLHFVTPLRLKVDNRFHSHAPAFGLLIGRMLNRFNMLYGLDTKARLISIERERILLEQAEEIELVEDRMQWRDQGYQRYSARQKTAMTFGGLVGEVEYRGNLAPYLPWLALAEYTHLGSQTTFGMGKFMLEID